MEIVSNDDWRDFVTTPDQDQPPDGDWIEMPCRGKIRGPGTVRLFRHKLPGMTLRIQLSGNASCRDLFRVIEVTNDITTPPSPEDPESPA